MRRAVTPGATVLLALFGLTPRAKPEEPVLERVTPLITVETIEPCLPFWTASLGFDLTASVPQGDSLAFAMLQKGSVAVMYQTRASLEADSAASGAPAGLGAELAGSTATLFIEAEELDPVIAALGEDADVTVPRRQTDYGMDEIFVRAPCGTLLGFAARLQSP